MSMRDMRARRRWQIWANASRSPCGVWPGRRARGGHLVPEGWRHGFRGNFGGIIRSLSTADLIKSTTYGPFREAGATRRGWWTGACTCPPSPMPYQASKQGGRSRHGHTLRNGIAAPEVVVQPQRSQRHAEPLACTWKRRFPCTCTPMSMCTRGTPPTPGDRQSSCYPRPKRRGARAHLHRLVLPERYRAAGEAVRAVHEDDRVQDGCPTRSA